ncbi:2-oxoglutarate-dependent dioxygenase DAO-like [Vigna radiata var. radiata]|uniref:2-oxoglutarate-dependent dioxygenase DAO-like n=1 Tax=Vigna radiata var. radiata TaxID=3916 RepID=A0A1S3VMR9_VIGRR|nr:2-oxoglutarate-dependent dioxygenase DAO-like [Vigna radiata var. radiata]
MAENFPVVIDMEKICEEEELKKLREACERLGSFRIINHSIPPTLVADMEKVVEALHDLPLEVKKRHTEAISGGGYVGPTLFIPYYEATGIYDISSSQSMNNFCSQLHVSPQQRQTMEAYGEAVHGLAVKIAQKMAESLGVVEGADFEDWVGFGMCDDRFEVVVHHGETLIKDVVPFKYIGGEISSWDIDLDT